MKHKSLKDSVARFFDECKMAGLGIVLSTKKLKFWLIFIPVFIIFGTLLSMFAGGFSAFNLFFATDFGGKMSILGSAFLSLFGVGRDLGTFLSVFSISLLQALLITLIVLIYKYRKKTSTSAMQNAGIATGLALLGSGCPTCGATLITPILTAIFSGGGYAIVGTVSGIITALAILVALYSIKKLGMESYVIMLGEKRKQRLEKKDGKSN